MIYGLSLIINQNLNTISRIKLYDFSKGIKFESDVYYLGSLFKPEKIINKPEIKDLIHINEKQFFSILDNLCFKYEDRYLKAFYKKHDLEEMLI